MAATVGVAGSGRLSHLESIRGLAALQVLLLHVFSAFVPGLVVVGAEPMWARAIHASPLFLLYDGYTAVYIFFVLSGVVLTLAFQRQADHPVAAVASRIVRLFVPAFVACLLALALKLALGDLHVEAGRITGSAWLEQLWTPPPGLAYWLKDSVLNPLFLGYQSSYPFDEALLPSFIESSRQAYVVPLWTLSVELQGSVLILLLVMGSRTFRLWPLCLAALAIVIFRSHFICFLAGHLLALAILRGQRNARPPHLPTPIVIALLGVGTYLCVTEVFGRLDVTETLCRLPLAFSLPCHYFPQKIYGAILIFAGLAFSAPLGRFLSRPAFVTLGRLSFPIYLVHWPLLMSCGSLVVVCLSPILGATLAQGAACLFVIPATLALATPFSHVDAFAIETARRCRALLARPRIIAGGFAAVTAERPMAPSR